MKFTLIVHKLMHSDKTLFLIKSISSRLTKIFLRLEILRILEENGTDLVKVCICHVDVQIDIKYCKKLCNQGVFIEFDNFDKEFLMDREKGGFAGGDFAKDKERVKAIVELIDSGFISNILLSNDICLKTLLHNYGGRGYDHLLTNIVPMLKNEGLNEDDIHELIIGNPKKFLENH